MTRVTDERTIDVEGSAVHVLDVGTGTPVLFLHGSGPGTTGSGAWRGTARALGGSVRVVAPDHAGFGLTPLPPGSRGGLRHWTDQAAGVMAALGIETYAVVGHSMGGAVALSLAAGRPEQVTRVVAVSTMGAPGSPLTDELDAVWGTTPGEAGARDMLGRLLLDPALVTASMVEGRAAAMEVGARSFPVLFPPPRERWAEDLWVSATALARIRVPVLLVHGAQDRVTPLRSAALPLLDHLADVRLHVMGSCGHVPAVEHPQEFQRLLSDFLLPPPARSRP